MTFHSLEDVIAYNTAINACGDVAEWQSALMLLQDVKSADMPSSLAKRHAISGSESVINTCS